jgi:hypothetical protein
MATGLLHLHSLLRWIIIILLLVGLFQAFSKKAGLIKTSLWLLISAHITLVIGLYQWATSESYGYAILKRVGSFGAVMKDGFARFWVVEHLVAMLIAIIVITIARGKAKLGNYKAVRILYLVALLLIVAAVPWPFRLVGSGRGWFPGMH